MLTLDTLITTNWATYAQEKGALLRDRDALTTKINLIEKKSFPRLGEIETLIERSYQEESLDWEIYVKRLAFIQKEKEALILKRERLLSELVSIEKRLSELNLWALFKQHEEEKAEVGGDES
ncbi:MAG: hypothetical protein LBT38_12270 [Deltaproteobacteria bacterium]|nr:hypothetical protein [Deltaproteobacteria bacterium]